MRIGMAKTAKYDFFFKMTMVGDIGVGKTSLLRTFTEAQFSTRVRPNDVADVEMKDIVRGSKTVRLDIWDTAGLERYRTITQSYYRNTRACLVMFDVTNETSFHNAPNWIADCLRYCPPKTTIVLVGTKCTERNREVPTYRAEALALEMKFPYMEVSSQDNYHVHELFAMVTDRILEDIKSGLKQRAQLRSNIMLSRSSTPVLPFDFCMKHQCFCS